MRGSRAPEGRSAKVNLAMSSDTSIQAVTAVRAGSDGTTEAKMPMISESPPRAEPAPAASPITNPTLRLDAALGIVVIEFRNDSGAITSSVPSQRQLQAYQKWDVTCFGPTPPGVHGPPLRTVAATGSEPHEWAPSAKDSGLSPAALDTAPVGKPRQSRR